MKQFILKAVSVFLALLMLSTQTFAFSSKTSTSISISDIQSIAGFEDSEIYDAFAEISRLDLYFEVNTRKTYNEVKKENIALLEGISSATMLPFSPSTDELAMGIPSFLWGCAFGWIGIVVVYLMTDKNKEETKKALKGCIANGLGVAVAVVYVVYFAVILTAMTTSSISQY